MQKGQIPFIIFQCSEKTSHANQQNTEREKVLKWTEGYQRGFDYISDPLVVPSVLHMLTTIDKFRLESDTKTTAEG